MIQKKHGSCAQGCFTLSPVLLHLFLPWPAERTPKSIHLAMYRPLSPSVHQLTSPTAVHALPIPRKQKQPSIQTPLGHWEGSGQSGVGCIPCSSLPESQAPLLQPGLPLQGSRSFRRWGQGVWAAYTLQTANSSSLGAYGGCGTTQTAHMS